MILYPAIDLMGGRIVRLRQGSFDKATAYDSDPSEAIGRFESAGAEWAHVVDLDGAKTSRPVQHEAIARLARDSKLKLQVGGGIRTAEQIEQLLEAGVERVVIGSLAVTDPARVGAFFERFGSDRITLSLDVRPGEGVPVVVISGWAEKSKFSLWQVAELYPQARHLLLTDVSRDGMLSGPNFGLLNEAVRRLPKAEIQASGGISSLDDLRRLRTAGVIVGKALWEGRFDVREALDAVA